MSKKNKNDKAVNRAIKIAKKEAKETYISNEVRTPLLLKTILEQNEFSDSLAETQEDILNTLAASEFVTDLHYPKEDYIAGEKQ